MNIPQSNTNEKPDLSTEIFGDKNEIKKILNTFLQSIKNVKVVIDDYYLGKGNYTKPVKYALTLIAPYVLLMQLLGIGSFTTGYNSTLNEEQSVIFESSSLNNFFSKVDEVNLIIGEVIEEVEPLFYAIIIVPILAFWLRKLFNNRQQSFSYYYALGIYLLITATFILYPLDFMSHYGLKADIIYWLIFITFIIYGIHKTFNESLFISALKSLLAFGLTLISTAHFLMGISGIIALIIVII